MRLVKEDDNVCRMTLKKKLKNSRSEITTNTWQMYFGWQRRRIISFRGDDERSTYVLGCQVDVEYS